MFIKNIILRKKEKKIKDEEENEILIGEQGLEDKKIKEAKEAANKLIGNGFM